MSAIGRISGPLLKSNLIRNGINLAFETDLLYLDVNNQRIGVKNSAPQYELDVNGTTRTTDLIVDNRANIADIEIINNTISTQSPYLNIATLDTVVSLNKLRVDSLDIEGNLISSNQSNADIDLSPNGTGEVNVNSNMRVNGNIHATGNISADGSITLGDADTDNVVFNAEVASNIIPDQNNVYSLGSDPTGGGKEWNNIWVKNLNASTVNSALIDIDGIDLTLTPGNTFYVSENGNDTNTGDHPQDPFATVKHAVENAVAGDTIHIYPGEYTEEFPITVPVGVSVKGEGIRSVTIKPTVGTNANDAFLLNGESTVTDLTVMDFYSPGYAFKFAPGFTVTSRSPYIKNVSVITKGSVTTAEDPRGFNEGDAGKGALVDGSVATASSKEAAMLFHSVTFITPGVDGLTATNGARIEWLNSFTYFANRSVYAFDSNDGLYNSGKTRIRLGGVVGTFAENDVITFTSTDSSTQFTATVSSVEGDYLLIDGKDTNFIGFDTTPQSISAAPSGASATSIENLDYRDFGAEIRMIGSASVYGNFGLYGDGIGVIVYAIGHNLAYIGNGKEVTNDPGTVIQANEVIELNDAQIRYNSVDHKGDFRVGDLFYVNQEDGTVDFAVTDFTINTTDGVTFNTSGQTTFIDGTKIETGDWRISGNTLETLTQDANITAAGGEINLDANVNITGNLDVTGNVTIGGNITIGDEATDTIQIVAGIDSDILPSTDSVYSLGSESKQWANLYINEVNVDDITIRDNFISTTASNADLELRANGTGQILVPSNDVQIDNNLTVDGTSNLQDTNINGTLSITGNISQTGSYSASEDFAVGQNLTIGASAQFEEILIDDNFITTTTSNTDLELRAAGTGLILIPNNNVEVTNNVTINGTTNTADITSTGLITADSFTTGNILIDDNVIETTSVDSDLELRANGAGIISIPTNNVAITNDLDVDGITNLDVTNIDGALTHVGDTNQTGNYTITGQFSNGNILINDNTIETTVSNSDLELRASGSGTINVPSNNVTFSQALTVSGATDLQNTSVTGTITHIGDVVQTGNFNIAGEISNGNILIEDNFIATTNSNSDLELRANGTGEVLVPNNDVRITNNLFVNGDATLGDTTLTGNVNITGDITQAGTYGISNDVTVGGDLTVTRSAQFEEILIDDNFVTTTTSNADLELRANGTGEILVPNNDVRITNDLIVDGTITVGDINSAGTITANRFSTGDILIDDNFITTTLSNSDLELRANGTGEVIVPSNDVTVEQDLTVNGTTTLANTSVTGTITHIGDVNQTGDFNLTGTLNVDGNIGIAGAVEFENIQIAGNVVETTLSNSDLELRANGTGDIIIPNNDVDISGNLTVDGTLTVGNVVSTATIQANRFTTGDILVDDNFITTTVSNSDLELRASGTGSIVIEDFNFKDSTISSTGDITLIPGSGAVIIDATGSLKLPTGDTSERPLTPEAGQIRYNSELSRFEGYNGTNWVNLKGVEDLDGDTRVTAELTEGADDDTIRFYVADNLVVDIDQNRLNALRVTVDDIAVDGNLISTTTADTNLVFTANGTGSVVFENFAFKDNTITNTVADSVTTFEATDNGYVKFDGTYGFVIPAGGNTQRPPLANTELGQMRWNTDAQRTEIYDGSNWVSVAGSGSGITRADAEDLALEIVLSLG